MSLPLSKFASLALVARAHAGRGALNPNRSRGRRRISIGHSQRAVAMDPRHKGEEGGAFIGSAGGPRLSSERTISKGH